MKKIPFLLIILSLWLASSCNEEKTSFTLKGKIENLPSDTLLLYYQVPEFKFDTLFCQNGSFTYTINPDTFSIFSLILNNEQTIPVYVDKGETVEITGTINDLNVKGNGENKLLSQITETLKGLSPEATMLKVDSCIQANAHSFTNIYLIDNYYIKNPSANYDNLERLVKNLHGVVKDTPYMSQLQTKIEAFGNRQKNQSILSLVALDMKGENVKWNSIRNKYILLNFWASWHPQSIIERDTLKISLKGLEKEDFIVYNISLDMDKKAWIEACDKENDQWKHLCDFKGWNSFPLRNQDIHELPFNVLLAPTKRVIAHNIPHNEIVDRVKQHKKDNPKKNITK
ncbi:MAG: DUF4369 domain-containing protein [Bacteroidaceae bacterium]|nr:DUF4369 domain-containing protein [Bacteroidaceae bacterium]MBR6621243.1 DUF4369 domain-containing protein [Bacteroides sp.]